MKMNEQEIIKFLKENKNKGIAFRFIPEEVQEWCINKADSFETVPFRKLDGRIIATWEKMNHDETFMFDTVYCLEKSYEPKPEFKPYWKEFEIDKNGTFYIYNEEIDAPRHQAFYWWQWQMFLSANDDKYNNFGGWLYKDDFWSLSPQVVLDEYIKSAYYNDKKITPATPIKIRFWRYQE